LARVRTHLKLKTYSDHLEREVAARTRELEAIQDVTILTLASLAETRDNETGKHIIRTKAYIKVLAEQAAALPRYRDALDAAMIATIHKSAPLHDIGKVGIPDHILLKPGRLEGEDLQTMRTHAAIGARMLGNHPAPIMQMACRIAACHHEKWDGSGYPAGLRGNEIPIEARIVAICDVFDALTSARPYKHAWPVNDALAYIREQAGQHFDPDLVARFLGIVPEILAIRSRHED
jgi:putative two-component system response regulator